MTLEASEVRPLNRITVSMSWGFIVPCVVFLFVGLALYPQLGVLAQMLGMTLTGEPDVVDWVVYSVFFMTVGVSGVVVHELSHALYIKWIIKEPSEVSLSSQPHTKHGDLHTGIRMMALTGPLMQGVYSLIILSLSIVSNSLYFGVLAVYLLIDMMYNLLPIKGHDGYKVFRRGETA